MEHTKGFKADQKPVISAVIKGPHTNRADLLWYLSMLFGGFSILLPPFERYLTIGLGEKGIKFIGKSWSLWTKFLLQNQFYQSNHVECLLLYLCCEGRNHFLNKSTVFG